MAQLYKYYAGGTELEGVVVSDSISIGMDKIDTANINLMVDPDDRSEYINLKERTFLIERQTDSFIEFRGRITEVRFPDNDRYNVILKIKAKSALLNELKATYSGDVMGIKSTITSVTHTPDYIGDTSEDFDDNDYTGAYDSGDMAVLIVPGESSTKVLSLPTADSTDADAHTGTFADVKDDDDATSLGGGSNSVNNLYFQLNGTSATAKASVVGANVEMTVKGAVPILDDTDLTLQLQYYNNDTTAWTNIGDSQQIDGTLWALIPTYSGALTFKGYVNTNEILDGSDLWKVRIYATNNNVNINFRIYTLKVEIYSDMKYLGIDLPISSWDANDGMTLTVDPVAAGVDVGDTYVVGRKDSDVLAAIWAEKTTAERRSLAIDIDTNFSGYTSKNYAGMTFMEVLEYFCEKQQGHWWYDHDYDTGTAEGRICIYKTSTLATEGSLRTPADSDITTWNFDDKSDSHVRSVTVEGATYKRGDDEEVVASATYPDDGDSTSNKSMKDLIHDDQHIYSWTEAKNVAEGMYNRLNDDTVSVNITPLATQTWILKDRVTLTIGGVVNTNQTITGITSIFDCGNNDITQTYHLGFQATSLEKRKANHINTLYKKINQLIGNNRDLVPHPFLRADISNIDGVVPDANLPDAISCVSLNVGDGDMVVTADGDVDVNTLTSVAAVTAPTVTIDDGSANPVSLTKTVDVDECVFSGNLKCTDGTFAASTVIVGTQTISADDVNSALIIEAITSGDGTFKFFATDVEFGEYNATKIGLLDTNKAQIVSTSAGAENDFTIEPSAAKTVQDSVYQAMVIGGDNLDPTATGISLLGLNVDFNGIDMTNNPHIYGVKVDLPATYGTGSEYAGYFTGDGKKVLICDDTYALWVDDGNVRFDGQVNYGGGTTYKVEADGDAVLKDLIVNTLTASGTTDEIVDLNVTDTGYVYIAFKHSNVRKAYMGIDNSANIRIAAEAGDLRLYTTGDIKLYDQTKIGDGGITNYAQFAGDGELTLVGTARVTRTMWLPFNALKAPGTKPATFKEWGISGVWEFSDATDDTVVFNMQMPYDMDKSVAPVISIGWSTNTAVTTETASWSLEYLYTQAGEDTTVGGATVTQTSNAIAQADGLIVVSFPALAVPHASDVCLHAQLKRLGADAVNDDLTDTAELHGVCLSYTSNKLGTAT